jgi:hypothetical protein
MKSVRISAPCWIREIQLHSNEDTTCLRIRSERSHAIEVLCGTDPVALGRLVVQFEEVDGKQ